MLTTGGADNQDGVQMRRFVLDRSEDLSGVSGTGEVARGVVFSDGMAVMRWDGECRSLGVYKDIEDVECIHGHQGSTTVRWLD
jgi:hypothetical protein